MKRVEQCPLCQGRRFVPFAKAHTRDPGRENLHWRVYKTLFRRIDRMLGHGDYLMAVARRA